MTASDNGRRSSRRGGLVLVAERGASAAPIAEELRRAGASVVTCDVVALPERVARMAPSAVVLELEQHHAEAVVARLLEPRDRGDRTVLAAIGPEARARRLGLVPGPRLQVFEPPFDPEDLVDFILEGRRHSIPASATGSSRSEIPSSVGSMPLAGDSDAMLMSDFPALAGLPEVETILPELEMSASYGTRGSLSPEIEALLDDAQKRVERAPPEPDNEPAPHILVPAEMMAAIDELLSDGAPSPAPQVSSPWTVEDADEEPTSGRDEPTRNGGEAVDDDVPEPTRSGGDAVDRRAVTSSDVPLPTGPPPRDRPSPRDAPTEPPRTAVGTSTLATPSATEAAAESSQFPMPASTGWSRSAPASGARSSQAPRTMLQHAPVPYPLAPSAFPPPQAQGPVRLPGSRPAAPPPPGSPRTATGGERIRISGAPPTRIQSSPPLAPPRAISREGAVGDPIELVAEAVAQRLGGALVMTDETEEVTRYLLLREGDLFNATSDHEDDSLLSFLVERGDLTADVAHARRGRLPNAGRHAAAALIAHGYLGQDDLWPVLRAHAEWILGRVLRTQPSIARLEAEAPERFRSEPNVFGGAAGAEVLLEAVRRVLSPEAALRRIGGPRARVLEGARSDLMAETALEEHAREVVRRAVGQSVAAIQQDASPELLPTLVALGALGVLTIERGRERAPDSAPASFDPIDAEAVRERVRARLGLVREGDYFSLLGVSPEATAYEIRRAFVDLRRTFEPSRLLSAATADLQDDASLICDVLEEAYEVLRDPARRKRYRRAIEAMAPR